VRGNSGWEHWPLGADARGNPVQNLSLQMRLTGSILVEWMVLNHTEVYIRRVQD
jgi:hypothetical protein